MHNFLISITDTDSIAFSKPDMSIFEEEEFKALVKELNDISPEFMDWADDGNYEACLVLKAKNYVLVQDGKYKYKGSSLKDTKREPAVREMLQVMIKDIIENESKNLLSIYNDYVKEAVNIQDISRWVIKKTVTKSVLNGHDEDARLNEKKVLDAIGEAISTGYYESVQEGDKLFFYNAVVGTVQETKKGVPTVYKNGEAKMIPNCIIRDQRLWNKDQDVEHYLNRVYKTVEILGNVINMDLFTDYTKKSNKELLNVLTSEVTCAKIS